MINPELIEAWAQKLADVAREQPMPPAAYAYEFWPEDDPRYKLWNVPDVWWKEEFIDCIADSAKAILNQERVDTLRALRDSAEVPRVFMASGLGMSLRELDEYLKP